MDLVKIGKFIASLRKDKNLTQEELAEKLYVTDRAVSKWERGLSLPDAGNMLDLCNILGITVNELLNGEKIDMKDYEKKTEDLLLEMAKQEEVKNKKLLADMWVIMITALLFYAGIITIAAITLEQGPVLGTIICASTALLVIVAFAAIGVGVFLGMTEEKETPTTNNTGNGEVSENEQMNVPTSMSFAGYNFTYPEDYNAVVTVEHGLTLTVNGKTFTIQVDYTNNYDFYKTAFKNAYPEQGDNMVTMIGEKEYVAAIITDSTGANATEYMTKAGETSTFVGLVVKSDYTPATEEDFAELDTILQSAMQQYEVNPGDEEDAGKESLVNYIRTFTRDMFIF